jgi:phospholipase C
VRTGQLPTVSWIVAPENFSDHPSAPWYGAWYVSETLDILTQNPDVWKKTIFILCYDENDGYFDHVPPFVAPHPGKPETGKASAGIDLSLEQVRIEQELRGARLESSSHAGPIGLGYRVPLVVASPWSRGGYVCSQVFDHTSIVQLLEKILSHRTGRPIRETNISAWRRTVCGDLTSAFRPYNGEKIELPKPVERVPFLEAIHQAQFKPPPSEFKQLDPADIQLAREAPERCAWLPGQEKGVRPSCALPYELEVDGALGEDRKSFAISFAAGQTVFGERAAGAPFHVYSPGPMPARSYAVAPGDRIEDAWPLAVFFDGAYHICVHGPNGFFREFRGTADDPAVEMSFVPERANGALTGNALLTLANRDAARTLTVHIEDAAYGAERRTVSLGAAKSKTARAEIAIELGSTHGWHDLRIRIDETPHFEKRYAGRIETDRESVTDPAMGRG